MFGLLGTIGWWMHTAWRRGGEVGSHRATVMTAEQVRDWTGGLAEHADRERFELNRNRDEKRPARSHEVLRTAATPDRSIADERAESAPERGAFIAESGLGQGATPGVNSENALRAADEKSGDQPRPDGGTGSKEGSRPGSKPGLDSEPKSGEKGVSPEPGAAQSADAAPAPPRPSAGNETARRAEELMERGRFVEARSLLSDALKRAGGAQAEALRALARRAADESIFSPRQVADDPLTVLYTVQSGDNLVGIGRRHDVPAEIVALVNELKSADSIRAGATLKIPRGPFHATVVQSEFRLDLYLQDTYVRSYPVGLGREQRTPNGLWRVVDRVPNPTYYPSENATLREVVPGGDPKNPLGTHWIKIEGIEGDAIGQPSYGIHGTNDPASIGKNESLGCVRMHNDDVAFVFKALRPGKSTVRTAP